MAAHEAAFNSGNWDPVMSDYAEDCVLELHTDGLVTMLEGRDAIRGALEQGSAMGITTRVERVVAADDIVAAQICDASGATFLTSFWHISEGLIRRDVSIVAKSAAKLT